MSTEHQRRANAANAKHSTGPTSDDGKARSSRNALTHGAYPLVDPITSGLLGEDVDEIQALVDGVVNDLAPNNTLEHTSAMTIATRAIGQREEEPLMTSHLTEHPRISTAAPMDDRNHPTHYRVTSGKVTVITDPYEVAIATIGAIRALTASAIRSAQSDTDAGRSEP